MGCIAIGIIITICVAAVVCAVVGFAMFKAGEEHRKKVSEALLGSAEEQAKSIVSEAEKAAASKKRELKLEAKEEIQKLRADLDKEVKERRNELNRQERRLNQKEETLSLIHI